MKNKLKLVDATAQYFEANKDSLHSCNSTHAAWVHGEEGEIYLRIAQRHLQGKRTRCLDIATVNIYEQYRSSGVLTSVVQEVEKQGKRYAVPAYAENLFEDRLVQFFIARGWLVHHTLGCEQPPTSLYFFPHQLPDLRNNWCIEYEAAFTRLTQPV